MMGVEKREYNVRVPEISALFGQSSEWFDYTGSYRFHQDQDWWN
jgi:hypothetical protein